MTLEELERQLSEHEIEVDSEEAMLIDWLLTLKTFDEGYLEWLMKPDVQRWREQAGRLIVQEGGKFSIDDEGLKLLVAIVPITYHFGQKDVGFSLKVKCYKAYLHIEEDKSENTTESETKDETPDSSEPGA